LIGIKERMRAPAACKNSFSLSGFHSLMYPRPIDEGDTMTINCVGEQRGARASNLLDRPTVLQ
jgi:hypothetical protein